MLKPVLLPLFLLALVLAESKSISAQPKSAKVYTFEKPVAGDTNYVAVPKDSISYEDIEIEKKLAVTLGLFYSGGIIGGEIEYLLNKRLGIQAGIGLVGFSAGINFHLKPKIKSSYFGLIYLQQGIGASYTESVLGPVFGYRSRKWFTFQGGFGYIIDPPQDPVDQQDQLPIVLLFSIGAYIAW